MKRDDSQLSAPLKDQADLTWLQVQVVDSGLLEGADPLGVAQIKTIISELGTNILKYAGRGTLSLKRVELEGAIYIWIKATDQGPGIQDINLALQDAYTTGNSLGLGLPSVRRLSDRFSIVSSPGQGTVVDVRKRLRAPQARHSAMDRISASISGRSLHAAPVQRLQSELHDLAGFARPMPGELVCGDLVFLQPQGDGLLIALVDVSGHGPKAAELAEVIRQHLASNTSSDIQARMASLHERLRGTQGAAVALLHVDLKAARVDFCGVGNVCALRAVGEAWRPISKDGVLGQRLPTPMPQSTVLRNGDVILMCSDGISELAARQFVASNAHLPADKLAVDLLSSLGRPFDDASCVVFKWIA